MDASLFKEDPCEILMGDNLNSKAYKTAVAFVPSMRMKVWKPRQKINSSNTFCYMDTNEYSYPTSNVCNSNLFGHKVPFIKNIFKDNKIDKTKTYPTEKCIFEIDKEKLTVDNLNTFWNKLNDLECTGQFAEYQNSNLILMSELQQLDSNIAIEQNRRDQLNFNISSNNQTLNSYRNINSILTRHISTMITSNDTLLMQQDQIKASINAISKDFFRFWENYTIQSNIYVNNIKNSSLRAITQSNNLSSNFNQIDVLTGATNKLNLKYSELRMAYSNVKKQFDVMYVENLALSSNLKIKIGELQGCQTSLQNANNDFNVCSRDLTNISHEYNQNLQNYNTCLQKSLNCYSNLNECLSNQNNLNGSNNSLIITYQKLMDNYNICMGIQSNLVAKSNALSEATINWLNTHYICDDQLNALKALDLQKETLEKTCRVADRTVYDTSLMNAQSLSAQSAAEQATTCIGDKNTMYTSVPVPPPPPTDSNMYNTYNSNLPPPVRASNFVAGANIGSVGFGGGIPFAFVCDPGSYVTEVYGAFGWNVDRIGVTCQGGKTGVFGGGGGSPFSWKDDKGFNGMSYMGQAYVDRIGVYLHDNTYVGTGGFPHVCPYGEKIMGIYGSHGHLVQWLGAWCTNMATTYSCP